MDQASPQSLYDLPVIYDALFPQGPCADFYRDLARRSGGPVLELACGTGRLTIPLATDGHEVVGLDRSAAMLEQGRHKARRHGVSPTLVEGDLRRFAFGRQFGLIIVSCNSLAHLTDSADLLACLKRIAQHLAPNGLLAFDVMNPQLAPLLAPGHSQAMSSGEGFQISETLLHYDPVAQVRTLRWAVHLGDSSRQVTAPMSLRMFFPQELPILMHAAGLELLERHGDFAGGALAADSLNQVCIAGRL